MSRLARTAQTLRVPVSYDERTLLEADTSHASHMLACRRCSLGDGFISQTCLSKLLVPVGEDGEAFVPS